MGIVATPDSSQTGSTQTKETPPPASLGVIVAPAEGEVIRVINSTPDPDNALREIVGPEVVTTTDALTQIASIDSATQELKASSPTATELPSFGEVGYTEFPENKAHATKILSNSPGTTDSDRVKAADRYPNVAEQLGWNKEDIDALRASLTGDDEKGDKFTRDFDHYDRVGTMYADLISEIQTNPTVSENTLMKKVLEGIHSMERMTAEVGRAVAIVKRFISFRESTTSLKEAYPDPVKLFEKVFGFVPEGKVTLIPGTIDITFHIPNIDDRSHAFSGTADKTKQIGGARTAAGFVTRRVVDGKDVNVIGLEYDDTPKVLVHERQHVVNNALIEFQMNKGKPYYFSNLEEDLKAGKDPKTCIDSLLKTGSVNNINGAIDEIVAFFSDKNSSAAQLKDILTRKATEQRGSTEYVKRFRSISPEFLEKIIRVVGEENRGYLLAQAENLLESNYDKIITECIDAYDNLLKAGYTREQTFGLLLNVPPESWKRFTDFKILKDKARGKV